jgi:hypothetical protein
VTAWRRPRPAAWIARHDGDSLGLADRPLQARPTILAGPTPHARAA